ncbi:ABC transporter ATP-binding protein [Pseudomonas piscis]|uniref:ABC transporter ATP-binding protein n=1 Tax=Pseudomonas piscis TaxID=2614538 RepID=UPI0021D59056|nr:ABC transporter ATP-binding protein [Pseudomonas piscis]MCU7650480.1 ABC transporter ATP-binding protein [Pseudomonas piscis]
MSITPMIELAGVTKTFKRGKEFVEIFRDLDLSFAQGEFVAIMGPSGSGKSTLLNLIGGLDQADRGTIRVGSQRLDQARERDLCNWRAANLSFIFQFYNLMPVLTARRNIELPLLLTSLTLTERRRRVEDALALVHLTERRDHYPREMSGGEQQRVAIARAIVSDPQIILCDEPTGDVDRRTANEILQILRDLNRELGKTILMVTHDAAASVYADRMLYLDKGRLIAEKRP